MLHRPRPFEGLEDWICVLTPFIQHSNRFEHQLDAATVYERLLACSHDSEMLTPARRLLRAALVDPFGPTMQHLSSLVRYGQRCRHRSSRNGGRHASLPFSLKCFRQRHLIDAHAPFPHFLSEHAALFTTCCRISSGPSPRTLPRRHHHHRRAKNLPGQSAPGYFHPNSTAARHRFAHGDTSPTYPSLNSIFNCTPPSGRNPSDNATASPTTFCLVADVAGPPLHLLHGTVTDIRIS